MIFLNEMINVNNYALKLRLAGLTKPAKIIKTPASRAFYENGPTRYNFHIWAHFARPGTITYTKSLYERDRPKPAILNETAP